MYIDHEAIRESILFSSDIKNINYILADRSYISLIALSISMEDYLGENYIKDIISKVIKNIENDVYHFPSKIIILHADYDITYQRNMKKSKIMDKIWTDEIRIKPQIEFYNYLVRNQHAVSISTNKKISESLSECLKACQQEQSVLRKEEFINGLYKYQLHHPS